MSGKKYHLTQLHAENKFWVTQREVIDEVKHNIKASENELQAFATSHNEIAIGHALFADHVELREEMDTFKKLYSELKDEFRHFLAKWM